MENNKITIGYKILLCLGLVLLTARNIQPRFRLLNRAVSSRELCGPSHVLPLRFTRANVHMDSGGTVSGTWYMFTTKKYNISGP